MTSRKADFKHSSATSSSRGKSTEGFLTVDQVGSSLGDVNLGHPEDGMWEVLANKNETKGSRNAGEAWIRQDESSKPWGCPDVIQKLGMRDAMDPDRVSSKSPQAQQNSKISSMVGKTGSQGPTHNPSPQLSAISPPPAGGWNWNRSRFGSSGVESDKKENEVVMEEDVEDIGEEDFDDDDSLGADDSDDDVLYEDYDSDVSQKSHGAQKKGKWFKAFFEKLDKLSVDEIGDPGRQWHCPACQGGPGAIDWFKGLQPLIAHATTKGSQRVKLHREFAKIVNEELRRRAVSVIPSGETYDKWIGLETTVKDHGVVWPPMVIIMNTRLDMDDNEKWVGMGNPELLAYFSEYAASKARHSYGPRGHRGISVLIFEASATGYLEAERLHKHFIKQGTDRYAWDHHKVLYLPGGKRQLYGYMALKEDMDIFNQHSQGKSKLKYDMRSYQEVVVTPMRQMSEDNQQLIFYKDKVAREKMRSKLLEQSFDMVTEKLRKTIEENRIVRQRTKMQHEQNKEEMDYQEQFFNEQIRIIQEAREDKEDEFESLQQEERQKVKAANLNTSAEDGGELLVGPNTVENFIKVQDEEMEEFAGERDKLIKAQKDKVLELKQRHMEELLDLEKQLDSQLTQLMQKYTHNLLEN